MPTNGLDMDWLDSIFEKARVYNGGLRLNSTLVRYEVFYQRGL